MGRKPSTKRLLEQRKSLGVALVWGLVLVIWGVVVIAYIQSDQQPGATISISDAWFPGDLNPDHDGDGLAFKAMRITSNATMGGADVYSDTRFYQEAPVKTFKPREDASSLAVAEQGLPCSWRPSKKVPHRLKKSASGAWLLPKRKRCATVEEMGEATVGDTTAASLGLRERIRTFLSEHGAEHVKSLPSDQFCQRNFVTANFDEAGFGNSMYRFLTAAGLALMLNRSLIVGELRDPYLRRASGKDDRPFISYLVYSSQTFRMQDVQRLWAEYDCAGLYKRRLAVRVDSFTPFAESSCLCYDWTTWPEPIIWYKETTDVVPLQYFLKNNHAQMRAAAGAIMGDPSEPDTRPNLFGELMHALVQPAAVVQEAVEWALGGGSDPDISLHLRMRSSESLEAVSAALKCISRITNTIPPQGRKLRLLVLSDTPSVVSQVRQDVGESVEVLQFDHEAFLKWVGNSNTTRVALNNDVPRKKAKDWGQMPRWVALVDFFLASRTRYALVSGAYQRVATTYAQLMVSLAAARGQDTCPGRLRFYSSFHSSLLRRGLSLQSGLGHSWRPFAGPKSCQSQENQCARTPLLSYAWWDAPWQSPTPRDLARMEAVGIGLARTGLLPSRAIADHCRSRPLPRLKTIAIQKLSD